MIRAYTASKLAQAPRWLRLHSDWPEVYCHARWLKHTQLGTPDTAENASRFWIEDEEDVKNADVLILFGDAGEHLRGALVEAGIAIACGVPVFVVGEHPDYGTWQYHPGVRRVPDFGALREALAAFAEFQP